MLQSMGSQRVECDSATELTKLILHNVAITEIFKSPL